MKSKTTCCAPIIHFIVAVLVGFLDPLNARFNFHVENFNRANCICGYSFVCIVIAAAAAAAAAECNRLVSFTYFSISKSLSFQLLQNKNAFQTTTDYVSRKCKMF